MTMTPLGYRQEQRLCVSKGHPATANHSSSYEPRPRSRRVPIAFGFAACLALAASLPAAEPDHPRRPNVIFILADDLGWSDTTLYGTTSLYETPGVEELAARGMTFTRSYSASPLCSPTRASILTGQSPARHGVTAPNCHLAQTILQASPTKTAAPNQKSTTPISATRLRTDFYTLGEMFRDNGYATGHFGKWHLGPTPHSPLEQGFDIDLPHHPGPGPAGSYLAPWKFAHFDHDPDTPHQHIEDRMASEAVAFIDKNRDRPFFLNYWMFSVHAPFDAKPELIKKYKSRIDKDSPQQCPTYAAMVESMDDAIVTLLEAVERNGLIENTIIIFTSDNGGNMYNEVAGVPPTSNAPLRGGKATMYEGGVRVPTVIIWPGKTKPGSRTEAFLQSEDFYPTLLDGLHIAPQPGQTFDGTSVFPILEGEPGVNRELFQYFPHSPPVPEWIPPSVSIHEKNWKLIRIFHGGKQGEHRYKLFDLDNDVSESNDLAGSHPALVAELDKKIEAFLAATGTPVPRQNPAFDAARYHPENEGVPARRKKPQPPKQAAATPVAGWTPMNCSVSAGAGGLLLKSQSPDPYLVYTLPQAITAPSATVRLTLASESSGYGELFWRKAGEKKAFSKAQSVRFEIQHDGTPHVYEIVIPDPEKTSAIRIDPARGSGQLTFAAIELVTPGQTLDLLKQINH